MKAFLILFFLFVFIAFFVVAAMSEALEKAWEFGRKYYILIIGILIFILYKIISNN
ncbi:hypothetical protein [Helicobacter pylori]|uniref:hypothetical protein n=1 Tax=Helicobacter pylori TaxID=210 RepID=UPI0002EA0F15|nr:hypothetical protein [Helicobacter pylori]WQS14606.1 hypothetical protein KVD76_01705 [Helicobacter pylori]WQS24337.1 hypothetical protein KVD61_01715 [Helicobacter pylori]